MIVQDLKQVIENGENSKVEFKEVSVSSHSLAEEIVAFANGQGGSIFIGVSDDGHVSGIDIDRKQRLEEMVMNICRTNVSPPLIPLFEVMKWDDQYLARIDVAEGLTKPYCTQAGKYLLRVGSTKRNASREELLRLFQNAMVHHIDNKPVPGAEKEDLDIYRIDDFFRETYELETKTMPLDELDRLLINSSIADLLHGRLTPTIAGLLFFGRVQKPFHPLERVFPHAGIQFVAYADDDKERILDRYECYENCPKAVDSIVHKIRLNWKIPSTIQGLERREQPFPEGIFRELVVNGVVHRDYSITGKIQIVMSPGKVEVITPGRLVNSVTVEKMKVGISICRNPMILKFMQNYRYADQLGRGIPMIVRKVEKMPGFGFQLQEEEDRFSAIVTMPETD